MRRSLSLIALAMPLATYSATAAAPGSAPAVTPWLLSLSQMPTGWVVSPPSSGTLSSCANVTDAIASRHPGHDGKAAFRSASGAPALLEEVASWPTASAARGTWAYIDHRLAGCHSVSAKVGKTPVAIAIKPLALPKVGNSSAGFEAIGTFQGERVVYALDIARKGRAVLSFVYGNIGTVDQAQAVHLLGLAVVKVKG